MSFTLPEFHVPMFEDASCISLLHQCPSRCCEYTFANLMLWRRHFGTEIALWNDAVLVRYFDGENAVPHYLAPAGRDRREALHMLASYCETEGYPLQVFGYDDHEIDWLASEYTVLSQVEHPDEFDYLYHVADLATLSGKKYHAKRNHIAAFSREYAWTYEPITDDNVPDVHKLADRWLADRVAEFGDPDGALRAENTAIHELLDHRAQAQIAGGLIRVGDLAVAFTFGAPLCADTFDTLVEKALSEYAGAYAVINREFARHALAKYTYVNRENDVGSEGLRRAKRSYHPVRMVKKTLCTLVR